MTRTRLWWLQLRNTLSHPVLCYLDPPAWRDSVRGVYEELIRSRLGRSATLENAEVVFCQKESHQAYIELRRERGLGFTINQLPELTRHLRNKQRYFEIFGQKPYALDTYVESCSSPLSGIWVEKPVDLHRGRGIRFLRDPNRWQQPACILQAYLSDPYLFQERKFDVRVLLRLDDRGECRVYHDGLVRCAHRPFRTDDLDPMIHNSNIAFQSTRGIEQYCFSLLTRLPIYRLVMDQINEIVEDNVRELRRLGYFQATDDFELLGYDFLIDKDGRVFMLEANTYPGIYLKPGGPCPFYRTAIQYLYSDLTVQRRASHKPLHIFSTNF